MIRQLVRRLRLVTRGELLVTQEKLRQVRECLDTTPERLARATAASERLQRDQREAAQRHEERLAALASEHERRLTRAGEAAAHASGRIAALEQEVQKRDGQLEVMAREAATLEARVAAALQDLDVARQHLLVVEVKLNILEGAANMLDTRLRAASGLTADDPK